MRTIHRDHKYFYDRSDHTTECWIWRLAKDRNGYGIAKMDSKNWFAHRLSYQQLRGAIPDGLLVCHECDNPSCVNPDHLFLGTHHGNTHDCIDKGRFPTVNEAFRRSYGVHYGDANGRCRISNSQIPAIKKMHSEGMNYTQIAKLFNVGRMTISRIVRGDRNHEPR